MIRYINLGACFSNKGAVPARLWTNRQKQLPRCCCPSLFPPSGQPDEDTGQALLSGRSLLFFPEEMGRGNKRKEKEKQEPGRRKGTGCEARRGLWSAGGAHLLFLSRTSHSTNHAPTPKRKGVFSTFPKTLEPRPESKNSSLFLAPPPGNNLPPHPSHHQTHISIMTFYSAARPSHQGVSLECSLRKIKESSDTRPTGLKLIIGYSLSAPCLVNC